MHDRFGLDSQIITPYAPFGAMGMGFVPRLTQSEIDAASAKKIAKMSAELFNPPFTNADINRAADAENYAEAAKMTEAVGRFEAKLKIYTDEATKLLGTTDVPKQVLYEKAFSIYSTEKAKPDFDRYIAFTNRYLSQIKTLTVNGVLDSASRLIQSRVESYPLEIPFFGQLSIYDIKLDNMASMNNLIDTVKTTDWTEISRAAIASFAPRGGYADYGVKAINSAISIANDVATVSSTLGSVGFSTGITTALGAIVPWALAAVAIIAICESLYGWLSGSADEEKQEKEYERAWSEADALHGHIQELLLLNLTDTNYTRAVLNMRLNEMAAYGSTVRDKLWLDCTAITRSDKTPAAYCSNPNALRSDGTTTAFVPVRHKSSKGSTKKKIMMCKVEYLKSVIQYLSGYEEIGDRRLAFEYLGMTTLPNSNRFALGLWDSDSYRKNPLVKFKPPTLSRAAQAEIQQAQADRIARGIEVRKLLEQKIQQQQAAAPKLTFYSAPKRTVEKKSSPAPLLIGAAAASAVYLYYNR